MEEARGKGEFYGRWGEGCKWKKRGVKGRSAGGGGVN